MVILQSGIQMAKSLEQNGINERRLSDTEFTLLSGLVNKIRQKILVSRQFGLSLPRFYRCIQSLKSREFCEWWYSPNNPGGRRRKRILEKWWIRLLFKIENFNLHTPFIILYILK